MSTFGQRLKEARKDKKLSQAKLAKLVGVSQPTIAELESEGKGSTKSALMAKVLGVSSLWLTEGRGEKNDNELHEELAGYLIQKGDEFVIPQHEDVAGAMGSGILLRDQPGQIRSWSVTKEWADKNLPSHTGMKNLHIVTGFGDSMKGMYNSGDPLIVDTGVKVCEYDGVYFFRVGNEGFIKRLQRIPGQGILVISQNQEYRDWVITADMEFEVLGKVLRAWKGENY